jgi:hypothetical protein
LPTATVIALAEATCPASAIVSAITVSCATTRFTMPHSAAVAASTTRPVSSISIARFRPTARVSATIGVEQNKPIFTPGVAKPARSLATARSHEQTNWQPAAVASPCTAAITGCGITRGSSSPCSCPSRC